jgi:hypothetical protein
MDIRMDAALGAAYCSPQQPSKDEEKGITKSGEQHGKQRQNIFQGRKATWKDFYATEDREERETILQEMCNGQLTPSELKEIMDA